MVVEITLTRRELGEAMWLIVRAGRVQVPPRWARIAALVLGLLLLVLMALATWIAGGLGWVDEIPHFRLLFYALLACVGLLIIATAVSGALPGLGRARITAMIDDDSPMLGWRRLTLDEQGLHEETRVGRSFTTWAGIRDVREEGPFVLLFVDRLTAHVVPKRVFDDEAAMRGFVAFAEEHVAKARRAKVDPDASGWVSEPS